MAFHFSMPKSELIEVAIDIFLCDLCRSSYLGFS